MKNRITAIGLPIAVSFIIVSFFLPSCDDVITVTKKDANQNLRPTPLNAGGETNAGRSG